MTKKYIPKIKAEGKAVAKVEASVKALYQRKKTVTEVIPEDVVRAKTYRWLDLISPITEWAGLKGDALRHKRHQLRIQQDATLEALASAIRIKMGAEKNVANPLPLKLLVPALEAVSLENAQSPLIDWWADLLVSGATAKSLRPYHIDLMAKIGSQEASLLEERWRRFRRSKYASSAGTTYVWLFGDINDRFSSLKIDPDKPARVRQLDADAHVIETTSYFMRIADEQGIGLTLNIPVRQLSDDIKDINDCPLSHFLRQSSHCMSDFGEDERGQASLGVCLSLGLLELHDTNEAWGGYLLAGICFLREHCTFLN